MKAFPVIDLAATGANIVRLRKEHGYSVADLQEFFGFEAPQAIYKWQQGKTLPSTDNLFALSRFLEVSIEEILVAKKFQVLPQEKSCGSGLFGGEKNHPSTVKSGLFCGAYYEEVERNKGFKDLTRTFFHFYQNRAR